jgi:hypothetical protein
VSRRTRRIIQVLAAVVIAASLVVARVLSVESDRVGVLGVAQAGLFVAFAIAALTLFATVVMDFDRWVDTVPPVPKRSVRRWVGRNARRISRLLALVLAWYGALMTWIWSTTGEALGWVLSRCVGGVSTLSVLSARAGTWVFSAYRIGAHWVWSWTGRGFVWVLGRVGEGLTWLWVSAVQSGAWVLVRYRAVAGWLWSSAGRGFVWVFGRVGEGLTWLWVWVVRAAGSGWAGFRAGMRWLWVSAGRGFVWVLGRVGDGLTWFWAWLVRACSLLLARCGAAVRPLLRATIGGERVATSTPRRRWYASAMDSVLGIPPEGTSLDPDARRRASRPRPANRPRPARRPSFRERAQTVGSRNAPSGTSESLTPDPRARYVGRQVTRRGERRRSEELLADALARFRSARDQPHDPEKDRDDR